MRVIDARRYFKQSEIVLYRQAPEILAEQAELARQQPGNQIQAQAPPPPAANKVGMAAA